MSIDHETVTSALGILKERGYELHKITEKNTGEAVLDLVIGAKESGDTLSLGYIENELAFVFKTTHEVISGREFLSLPGEVMHNCWKKA